MEESFGLGWNYGLQWQVVVCALIFVVPSVVAVVLIRRVKTEPLYADDLWVPCWRNLHPLWLLFYRALAFFFMAFVFYQMVASYGAVSLYFYTQWSFALVMVYFAIATAVSACGCWMYGKRPPSRTGEQAEFLENDSDASGYNLDTLAKETKGNSRSQGHYNQEEIDQVAGCWGYVMQIIYQIGAGAAILTDIVFWCLILPFLTDESFHVNFLIGCTHTLNAIFLIVDSSLNSQKFPWYRLAYFVLWSVVYVVFHWVLHACGFTWWPYPFLDLSTPLAPLWYLGLALVHIPCFGLYVLLIRAKNSIFSRLFPSAFVRSYLFASKIDRSTSLKMSSKIVL